MKYKNRALEKTLKKYIGKYPVIMITGPRQVGKTTLLNYIANNTKDKINYVTFDDPLLRVQANDDPELFLRTHEAPLIIDEFQYAPNLLSFIKMRVDNERNDALFKNKKQVGTLYYLTGSQIFQTMRNVSESLAGRIGIFDLLPFSSRELNELSSEAFIPEIKSIKKREPIKYLNIKELFERILKGSYPEVHYGMQIDFENYYQSYIRTYLERDIREIIKIKDENKFIKFISSLAARTGQEFVTNQIGMEIGIDNKTVEEWLSILKNTGIIYLLQPYMNNNVSRIIKRPKIYFLDTGLACYLTGYSTASILAKSAYSGQIFETYVVSEIIKSFINDGKDPRNHLFYYRDNNHREIDLLIKNEEKIYPVEIKKSAAPRKDAIKSFNIVENFELEKGNGIVLCLIKEITAIDDNNYFVPIEYI